MKPPSDDGAARPRGRPRAPDVTDRILAETLTLLAARGYHGLTIDEVAARCRTSKQAIYRRWTSKAALAAGAVEHALARANPSPPEGPLALALEQALGAVADLLTRTPFGGAVNALIGVRGEPALVAALARVEADRRQLLLAVLARARSQNAYRIDRDPETDVDLLLGALYFRHSLRRLPVTGPFVAAVVASWIQGASAAG